MAEALGLGVALWSPLGGGLLTGKYRSAARAAHRLGAPGAHRGHHAEDRGRRRAAGRRARDRRAPAQVPMAWLRRRRGSATTALVPVIGPRNVAQLDDYLAALDVDLVGRAVARLDEVSAVALGVPHEVAAGVHDSVLGGDASRFRPPAARWSDRATHQVRRRGVPDRAQPGRRRRVVEPADPAGRVRRRHPLRRVPAKPRHRTDHADPPAARTSSPTGCWNAAATRSARRATSTC